MQKQQLQTTQVLYIEDQPINSALVEHILRDSGYGFIGAYTGAIGIEQSKQAIPNVILVDMQLPDMNSIDVVSQIRSHDITRNIPIVAIATHAYDVDRSQHLRIGCDGYLSKPIHRGELLNMINMFVRGHATAIVNS